MNTASMPKVIENRTPLSEFRRAAAKALRQSKQNEMEATDPPVEFYLISNLIINGNPKSTLEQILQAQADKQIESTTSSELDTATPPTSATPLETVASESPSDPIPVPETVASEPLPVSQKVTPMPNPIPQKVNRESSSPTVGTAAAQPFLIGETVNPILNPNPSLMPKMIDTKPPPSSQPYIFKKENMLPPLPPNYYLNGRKQARRQELYPSRQRVRVATAAAAAATATVAAQVRQNALDALAYKHAAFLRLAEKENPASDQKRVMRNRNLLSSALNIIREMDAAYLEILCYAIHDQVTSNESSSSN
ncbi:hypothetical protein ACLKA6_016311 [Drosophila palustris]